MSETPNIGFTLLETANAQKEVLVNGNSVILDALLGGVTSRAEATPPGSPAEGDAYIVAATATGVWATHEDEIAYYFGGVWNFLPPESLTGHPILVRDENLFVIWVAGSPGGYQVLYALYQPFIVSQRIGAAWSNGGSALVAEDANIVYARVSTGGTIVRITILGAITGDCEIDIFRDSFANYPPSDEDSIFSSGSPAADYPAIVAGNKYEDTLLEAVDTTVNAGDVFGFRLRSSSGFDQLSVYVEIE